MWKVLLPEQLRPGIKISLHGWLACSGEMSSCDDHGKCPMKLQLIPQTCTDNRGYGINRSFRAWWLEIHTSLGVNLVRADSCYVHTSQVFELHVLISIISHRVGQHNSNAGHLDSGGSRLEILCYFLLNVTSNVKRVTLFFLNFKLKASLYTNIHRCCP